MENLELAGTLRAFLRHGVHMSRRWSDELELSTTHLGILNLLIPQGVRVSDVARDLGVKMPSATEALKRLGAVGLVVRAADPEDSRAVIIQITERGEQARRRGNLERDQRIADVLDTLSAEDLATLDQASGAIERLTAKFQNTISDN